MVQHIRTRQAAKTNNQVAKRNPQCGPIRRTITGKQTLTSYVTRECSYRQYVSLGLSPGMCFGMSSLDATSFAGPTRPGHIWR